MHLRSRHPRRAPTVARAEGRSRLWASRTVPQPSPTRVGGRATRPEATGRNQRFVFFSFSGFPFCFPSCYLGSDTLTIRVCLCVLSPLRDVTVYVATRQCRRRSASCVLQNISKCTHAHTRLRPHARQLCLVESEAKERTLRFG